MAEESLRRIDFHANSSLAGIEIVPRVRAFQALRLVGIRAWYDPLEVRIAGRNREMSSVVGEKGKLVIEKPHQIRRPEDR